MSHPIRGWSEKPPLEKRPAEAICILTSQLDLVPGKGKRTGPNPRFNRYDLGPCLEDTKGRKLNRDSCGKQDLERCYPDFRVLEWAQLLSLYQISQVRSKALEIKPGLLRRNPHDELRRWLDLDQEPLYECFCRPFWLLNNQGEPVRIWSNTSSEETWIFLQLKLKITPSNTSRPTFPCLSPGGN